MLTSPLRVPLAREQLRQRLVMNAGVDPNSGYWLGDDATNYLDETVEDRASRIEYLHRLNLAVSHIAGLIEGCHIRVWRDRDGSFELASPVGTAQAFYVRDGQMDDLYFERSEWDALLKQRYPETELARRMTNDNDGGEKAEPSDSPRPAPFNPWSEEQMIAAIKICGFSNSGKAWREHFKQQRDDHGWSNEAFRSVWSRARGTAGMKGRPPKRP